MWRVNEVRCGGKNGLVEFCAEEDLRSLLQRGEDSTVAPGQKPKRHQESLWLIGILWETAQSCAFWLAHDSPYLSLVILRPVWGFVGLYVPV